MLSCSYLSDLISSPHIPLMSVVSSYSDYNLPTSGGHILLGEK